MWKILYNQLVSRHLYKPQYSVTIGPKCVLAHFWGRGKNPQTPTLLHPRSGLAWSVLEAILASSMVTCVLVPSQDVRGNVSVTAHDLQLKTPEDRPSLVSPRGIPFPLGQNWTILWERRLCLEIWLVLVPRGTLSPCPQGQTSLLKSRQVWAPNAQWES